MMLLFGLGSGLHSFATAVHRRDTRRRTTTGYRGTRIEASGGRGCLMDRRFADHDGHDRRGRARRPRRIFLLHRSGRRLRRQIEPALEDFARELSGFRSTIQKAVGVAR